MGVKLDLQDLACHNPECLAYLVVGMGNLVTGSRYGSDSTRARYTCVLCGKSFALTRGSMFYRLHTEREAVLRTLAQLPTQGSIRATARATGVHRDTIGNWIQRALAHREEATQQFGEMLHMPSEEIQVLWRFLEHFSPTEHDP
ncbi:MAG TPA: IS1 family transposase [Chloroflexi bacterium]|mgnify:CR=1 FL=1|nr:IS1 family transposase [Chloroflexota bacterium]